MKVLKKFAQYNGWLYQSKADISADLEDGFVLFMPMWSMKNLNLIDGLSNKINVFVMNIDEFKLQKDTVEFFGEMRPINQTLIIMKIIDGRLVRMENGESIERFFN